MLKQFSLSKNTLLCGVALSLVSFGLAKQAVAQVTITPVDLSTWGTLGDVEVVNPGLANLSTDAVMDDDSDLGDPSGTFNYSGGPASPIENYGEPPFLNDFLNVDLSVLDGDSFATEGSAMKTSLTVKAGDILNFEWNFLTNETSSETMGPRDDYGFLLVNDDLTILGNPEDSTSASTLLDSETGTNSFSLTFDNGGTYQIAVGVLDREDFVITSALNISDVTLTRLDITDNPTVPEPGNLLGLLLLTGGLTPRLLTKLVKLQKNIV